MNSFDPQQLLIGTGALGLLAYVAKLVIPNLLKKIDEKDSYIEGLTTKFTETINHKTTEWTSAMNRLADSQEKQVQAQQAQIEVFKKLIDK